MDKKIFTECDCGTHLIQIIYDDEVNLFYFAIFNYGHENRSVWNRIKYAFNHLISGKIYEDQIVLNCKEANKLSKFITDSSNEKN